jgi:hypothetical protein
LKKRHTTYKFIKADIYVLLFKLKQKFDNSGILVNKQAIFNKSNIETILVRVELNMRPFMKARLIEFGPSNTVLASLIHQPSHGGGPEFKSPRSNVSLFGCCKLLWIRSQVFAYNI